MAMIAMRKFRMVTRKTEGGVFVSGLVYLDW